jgi:hypothetical protein
VRAVFSLRDSVTLSRYAFIPSVIVFSEPFIASSIPTPFLAYAYDNHTYRNHNDFTGIFWPCQALPHAAVNKNIA